jgi:hypothetical protein
MKKRKPARRFDQYLGIALDAPTLNKCMALAADYSISRSALIRRMIDSEWEEFRKLKLLLEKAR